jgi:hypothetical protein
MTAEAARHELLLRSMRTAVLNLRGWQAEIEMIGVALRAGEISTDDACAWLDELGLLHHLPEPERAAA